MTTIGVLTKVEENVLMIKKKKFIKKMFKTLKEKELYFISASINNYVLF